MSKHMQLTVKIRPYYRKGLEGVYPEITRRLRYVDEEWVDKGPSLFDIVGRLDKLLYALDGNPPFREILLHHRAKLHELYEKIEAKIADWHLAEADKLLYAMEDVFDEVEREVSKT
jgi:hypothetical protein